MFDNELHIERGLNSLQTLLKNQLSSMFHFEDKIEEDILYEALIIALEKTLNCFSFCKNKYYRRNNKVYFNQYQGAQNSIFLYYLSFSLAKIDEKLSLADRIYYLNKCLNSVDLYHQVKMPDIFSLDHPIGSVIGRADYGNFFSFRQNCTVGNNRGVYPVIGENVRMMAGSSILGSSNIGDNVLVAANSLIIDEHIPNNSIVFGQSPNLIIKSRPEEYFLKDKGFP